MKPAPLPTNESGRLSALYEYKILDTLPEEAYDEITRIASEIMGTPIALLNLVDQDRTWTKANHGLDATKAPRELSFCPHAILNPDEVMIVEDARYDERFHDNPFTTGAPNVIFYAGVPVVNEEGFALGTLCVIDSRSRTMPENKLMALQALAKLVQAHFELRKTKLELTRLQEEMRHVSRVTSLSGPALADQRQELVATILSGVDTLVKNGPRPDQALPLAALKDAANALEVALATH